MSDSLSAPQVTEEVRKAGGKRVSALQITRQVYCDLDEVTLNRLVAVPGLIVKRVHGITSHEVGYSPSQLVPATYAASTLGVYSGFYDFRRAWDPPITGQGATIAILDSGIRKTHEGLRGKVIYEENFSNSPTVDDVFDHGTGVAYIAAGGRHAPDEESGIAPDAYLWSMKVLDDDGQGSEENVVRALERCYELEADAELNGLSPGDPMDLNFVNMSFGSEDAGDPDNPVRRAIRSAVECFGGRRYFVFVAAAGNFGPAPGTITCPACDPNVIAVGASTFNPFQVWEQSSRGPTVEGLVKPDFCGFGVRTLTASAKGDDVYVVKSGTSFAAPTCCGGMAAVWEGMRRQYGERFWETLYSLGPQGVLNLGAEICVKPEGIPPGKDNEYGYGLVSGLAAIEVGKASQMVNVGDMVVPMAAMGFLAMMMTGMARSAMK